MRAEAILVVDYEENIRQLVVSLLDSAGYRVFQADSIESALEIVGDRRIDLLLCKARMPEGSGIELALRAQEAQPQMGVLLTTGHLGNEGASVLDPSRARVLEHPFRPELLLSEVRKVLAGRPDDSS